MRVGKWQVYVRADGEELSAREYRIGRIVGRAVLVIALLIIVITVGSQITL